MAFVADAVVVGVVVLRRALTVEERALCFVAEVLLGTVVVGAVDVVVVMVASGVAVAVVCVAVVAVAVVVLVFVAVDVDVSVVEVAVVVTQVPHITRHSNFTCLPTKLSRAQSVMLYVVPHSDGSGFPLQIRVVVVVVIVVVVIVVVVIVVVVIVVVEVVGTQVPHISGHVTFA